MADKKEEEQKAPEEVSQIALQMVVDLIGTLGLKYLPQSIKPSHYEMVDSRTEEFNFEITFRSPERVVVGKAHATIQRVNNVRLPMYLSVHMDNQVAQIDFERIRRHIRMVREIEGGSQPKWLM